MEIHANGLQLLDLTIPENAKKLRKISKISVTVVKGLKHFKLLTSHPSFDKKCFEKDARNSDQA